MREVLGEGTKARAVAGQRITSPLTYIIQVITLMMDRSLFQHSNRLFLPTLCQLHAQDISAQQCQQREYHSTQGMAQNEIAGREEYGINQSATYDPRCEIGPKIARRSDFRRERGHRLPSADIGSHLAIEAQEFFLWLGLCGKRNHDPDHGCDSSAGERGFSKIHRPATAEQVEHMQGSDDG